MDLRRRRCTDPANLAEVILGITWNATLAAAPTDLESLYYFPDSTVIVSASPTADQDVTAGF